MWPFTTARPIGMGCMRLSTETDRDDTRSLEDDPVRVLRAARFGAEPGWRLGPGLESAALGAAPGLSQASAERVRDEILAILAGPASAAGLRVLQQGFGDPRYRPSPLLVRMVDAGWLGRKTKRGFYRY